MVEPEPALRLQLHDAAADLGVIDTDCGMPTARNRLLTTPYTWLVTNIRLDAYNGLHLAYLARMAGGPISILVYGDDEDLVLAREAQELGAFYESRAVVSRSLAGYLTTPLPPKDRRDVGTHDRRGVSRGGRRRSDARLAQLIYQ